MMPPLPITIALAVLIGWPTIQLAAQLLLRPKWRRFNELTEALRRDPSISETERKFVADLVGWSWGDPIIVIAPIVLPWMLLSSIRELFEERSRVQNSVELFKDLGSELHDLPRDAPLWSDKRFVELLELEMELEILRWPISSFLTFLCMLPILPLIILASGSRATVRRFVPNLLHGFNRLVHNFRKFVASAPAR